ncbi:hypothetical protein J6590_005567 [Homalodisca vitripennis]|nr:hypothetical protein J6590_005567 [Homalodisca vitripennis]
MQNVVGIPREKMLSFLESFDMRGHSPLPLREAICSGREVLPKREEILNSDQYVVLNTISLKQAYCVTSGDNTGEAAPCGSVVAFSPIDFLQSPS